MRPCAPLETEVCVCVWKRVDFRRTGVVMCHRCARAGLWVEVDVFRQYNGWTSGVFLFLFLFFRREGMCVCDVRVCRSMLDGAAVGTKNLTRCVHRHIRD